MLTRVDKLLSSAKEQWCSPASLARNAGTHTFHATLIKSLLSPDSQHFMSVLLNISTRRVYFSNFRHAVTIPVIKASDIWLLDCTCHKLPGWLWKGTGWILQGAFPGSPGALVFIVQWPLERGRVRGVSAHINSPPATRLPAVLHSSICWEPLADPCVPQAPPAHAVQGPASWPSGTSSPCKPKASSLNFSYSPRAPALT